MVKLSSFPVDAGLAGTCFTERRAIFGTVGKTKHLFQEIDHVTMNGEVRDFVLVPLYGYWEEVVGVLEMVNKKGGLDQWTEAEEFEVYQKSIGLMIRHIEEINTTLAASFSLKKIMYCLQKMQVIHNNVNFLLL